MIYIIHFLSRILLLFIIVILIKESTGDQLYDYNANNFTDVDTSVTNESLPITPSINIENSTNTFSSSSLILNVLLKSGYTPMSNTIENESISVLLPSTFITHQTIVSANSLVDQINSYRNIDILSHIKQCDPNMKLNDICEIYSIDKNTNSLIRESNIEFDSLQHVSDSLVDRIIVEKLNKFCLPIHWCLGNLSQNDIQFTIDIIRERGRSFCSLDQCHSRLLVFINSCPTLSNMNISVLTLKLLPMLCTLYNEQQSWSSIQCIEEIVYLLHILYAYWSQLETCYFDISTGFNGCTSECQTFDDIFNKVVNQCDGNASFLSQVPALAWYRSINLKEICHQKSISTTPSFIYSIKKFFSSNTFWYQFDEKSIYMALFIIIVICLVKSLFLCCYLKLKYRLNSNNRRFDDNYEYTRLHDSSFELGTNTEILNTNLTANEMMNEELLFDSHGRFHSPEYQRLLHTES